MNTKIFLLLVLSIFLVSNASAIVVYGDWQDGSQHVTITKGESVDFNADFFSMNPPMTINIKLYKLNENLIYSFENNKIVNGNSYYNTYTITENIYDTTGEFEVVLQGQDSINSDEHTLSLTVNEAPQENHPPVAYDSSYTTNEDTNIQVIMSASDPDEDELDYIITDAPNHGTLSGTGQTRT